MKNAKFAKITTLILALAMLVAGILGITASANTEESPSAEIVLANITIGDRFEMMFAVDTSLAGEGNTVKVVYTKGDSSVERYATLSADGKTKSYTRDDGTVVDCPIYYIEGTPARSLAEYIYAKAVVVDSEGNELYRQETATRYSIAQYLYSRLYRDVGATAEQKALYESILNYGANAQTVLDGQGTLVTDYIYVYAEDGSIDADGNSSGIFAGTTEITLNYTGTDSSFPGWSYTANGETLNIKSGDTVTLSEHTVFTVSSPTVGFDSDSVGTVLDLDVGATNGPGNVKVTASGVSSSRTGWEVIISDEQSKSGSNSLKVTTDSLSSNSHVFVENSNLAASGNCYVFETDMYLVAKDSSGNLFSTTQTLATIDFRDASNNVLYAINLRRGNLGGGTSRYLAVTNANTPGTFLSTTQDFTYDAWHNFRMEVYIDAESSTANAKFYLDGNLWAEETVSCNNPEIEPTKVDYKFLSDGTKSNSVTYFDNMYFERTGD